MRRTVTLRGLGIALVLVLACQVPVLASPTDDVAALFSRFVAAQNAHDPGAVSDTLLDSPNFLWITRGTPFWGRDAAIQRFKEYYAGAWRLDVQGPPRITMLSADAAQLYAPIDFTIGTTAANATVTRFLLNQTLVKTPRGWVVASILGIPAATPPIPKPSPSP